MPRIIRSTRFFAAAALALSLGACAGTYTGPVEVTRFVADSPVILGQGNIETVFPEEMSNKTAQAAFDLAVSQELSMLGYDTVSGANTDGHIAEIRTSRGAIESAGEGRGPVNVGVGGSTGSYGSGVGLGVGINLGGGERGPTIVSELEVRIKTNSGDTLWEGRAQLPTSVKSPYSQVNASARALAAALFRDFPGNSGETITVQVDELQGQE